MKVYVVWNRYNGSVEDSSDLIAAIFAKSEDASVFMVTEQNFLNHQKTKAKETGEFWARDYEYDRTFSIEEFELQ